MPTLKSNKLALNNPIPEKVQNDFLSDYCPIVYCIEVSDGDMILSEKFYNWDELVEFVKSTHGIFEEFESSLRFGQKWKTSPTSTTTRRNRTRFSRKIFGRIDSTMH